MSAVAHAVASGAGGGADTGAVTLLVAEDNAINQKVIAQQLMLLGYFAEIRADGVEALAAYEAGNYALLLTDCNMPNMDGYALAREVRGREQAAGDDRHLPIVALTANAHVGEEAKCFAAGMDALLTKPTDLHKLDEVLGRLLSKPVAMVPAQESELLATRREVVLIDREALMTDFGDESALVALALAQFRVAAEQVEPQLAQWTADGRAPTAQLTWLKNAARAVHAEPLASMCEDFVACEDGSVELKDLRALLLTTARQIRPA